MGMQNKPQFETWIRNCDIDCALCRLEYRLQDVRMSIDIEYAPDLIKLRHTMTLS